MKNKTSSVMVKAAVTGLTSVFLLSGCALGGFIPTPKVYRSSMPRSHTRNVLADLQFSIRGYYATSDDVSFMANFRTAEISETVTSLSGFGQRETAQRTTADTRDIFYKEDVRNKNGGYSNTVRGTDENILSPGQRAERGRMLDIFNDIRRAVGTPGYVSATCVKAPLTRDLRCTAR